jgi:glucokinase
MGVDVGGTKILAGVVDENGQILYSQRYPTNRTDQEAVLNSIQEAVEQAMKSLPQGMAPGAMGVGLVGWVDPASGTWLQSMNLNVDSPIPLADVLSSQYGIPVVLDNDVHAAALAEIVWGIGRQSENFIYLNAGTGIAAGVVCNGRLVRGAANYAGELGHMFVDGAGEACVCGQIGCLEPLASGGGMLERVRAYLPRYAGSCLGALEETNRLSATAIFEAADGGDALAALVAGEAIAALGTALVNVINLLNPEYVVLGGGIFSTGRARERLQDYVQARALAIAYRSLKGIIPSSLEVGRVGLLGAASLAWQYRNGF